MEEKIVALQRQKKGMADEVYSDLEADGTMESGRPTTDGFKLIFGNLQNAGWKVSVSLNQTLL